MTNEDLQKADFQKAQELIEKTKAENAQKCMREIETTLIKYNQRLTAELIIGEAGTIINYKLISI